MKVELHIIQNFAPSCLNRDDVNAPKDCEFGGFRRARISSQCQKRSVRTYWNQFNLLSENRAIRTKRIVDEVARRLAERGRGFEEAKALTEFALTGAGLGVKQGATEYLLFVSEKAISGLAAAVQEHWDELSVAWHKARGDAEGKGQGPAKKKKDSLGIPQPVQQAVAAIFATFKAADIALFGRMVADAPEHNVDAACQVAHAISTHRVSTEVDFYSAVDDLQPREEAGAGMLGTVEFNSACFYRYAVVDMHQLRKNLDGDGDLAAQVLQDFVRAWVEAIPSGKQNSMAAHNPPSFVMAVVRSRGAPWSLANAFENPVRAGQGGHGSLVVQSIQRLDDYWGKLNRAYGDRGIADAVYLCVEDVSLKNLGHTVDGLEELLTRVTAAVKGDAQWESC